MNVLQLLEPLLGTPPTDIGAPLFVYMLQIPILAAVLGTVFRMVSELMKLFKWRR